jgi:hypothetical protein
MASPLLLDEKLRLLADATYMVARLLGEATPPPQHWSAEQIAAFAGILEDAEARAALWAQFGEGQRRLDAAADAMDDNDGPLAS